MKAKFYIVDSQRPDREGSDTRIAIYAPTYVCHSVSDDPYHIEEAKRTLINKLIGDLMEADDWHE